MTGVFGTRWRTATAAALITSTALVLTRVPASAGDVTVKDAGGRSVTIADARRIVSIGGAVTEILYALGLESRIVAVDTTSLHPPRALAEKPNVGYMRQLSPEGILAMSPSLVLAIEGAGPPEAVSVLQAARVPFVQVPERYTADGILDKIRLVSEVVGEAARGVCLIDALKRDFSTLEGARARSGRAPRVLFVLSFVNDRAMVAGRDTAADGIIRMAGAENAMPDLAGYKPVGDEAVIAAQPDVVLMMDRPGQPVSAETVLGRPAFAMTPAGTRKALVVMNGQYLLGFGPRTALAARDLAARLFTGPPVTATQGSATPTGGPQAAAPADTMTARHDAAIGGCAK
ncbi:MAG: ABC transporter substrate-binding protein [Rhodoplanes sp.]|uniref:heme/hemin ABC transporter substrate-binding protein n=1 Tax=Rhodoplanes sp. TaxID=1968906 RepID=UPI00182A276E|nr:ABC transporter substrate-binding protein [Rhodoplanes sp.]NVO15377.1 ABC transporter substrate-binding protein [Rhodoplanes sp.]